jgi:hypothetical protein
MLAITRFQRLTGRGSRNFDLFRPPVDLVDVRLGCAAKRTALTRVMLNRRAHEAREQRMWQVGLALELGMELAPDKMWMPGELHHLDKALIRRDTAQDEAATL